MCLVSRFGCNRSNNVSSQINIYRMDTIQCSFHKGCKAHRYDKPENIDTYQSQLGKIQTKKKKDEDRVIHPLRKQNFSETERTFCPGSS